MAGDWEQKPADPADATRRGVQGSQEARLAWLLGYLERHPTATLQSGEGALLAAEIRRLREEAERLREEVARLEGENKQLWLAVDPAEFTDGMR